jgi:hypothetical protein
MEIELEFVSSDVLAGKNEDERINFILERIRKSKILVLEESLSATEEARLIEETMREVSDKFPGIEVSNLKEKSEGGLRERLIRFLGGSTGGMTIIGPSKLIKKIKKEPQRILVLAEKESR